MEQPPQGQPKTELTDAKYGENKLYEQMQQVMPGAAAQQLPPTPTPTEVGASAPPAEAPQSAPLSPLGDFMAPSERPGEPITSGAPMGAGPNTLQLGPNATIAPGSLSSTLAQYGAADTTGIIAELAQYFDGMNI